jgi:hypothetical protein
MQGVIWLWQPFPAFSQVETPFLLTVDFRYPMFRFAKTETTCFTLKSYPLETKIGWLPEPHKFIEGHIMSQQLYVIFECVLKQKQASTKIKQEPEENLYKIEGTYHELNKRTTLLIEQVKWITDLLKTDVIQAKLDWMALLN